MNRIFFIFLVILPLLTIAQNTFVPDDNFEQILILQSYDTVIDDYILTVEKKLIIE